MSTLEIAQEIATKTDRFVHNLNLVHGRSAEPEIIVFTRVMADLIIKGYKRNELHKIMDQHADIIERKLNRALN